MSPGYQTLMTEIRGPVLLVTEEAARVLNVAPGTLAVWRCTKRYPLPFVRVGRAIRYRLEDLEAFIMARRAAGDGKREISTAPEHAKRGKHAKGTARASA